MAVKGTCSVTIFVNKEIQAVWRYYLLRGSTMSAPAIDDKSVRPPTTGGTEWTAYEPAFSEGATNSLYFTDCMVFTDGSISYSEVSKSTSYEAAKEAYHKAQSAQTAANDAQSTADNAQEAADNAQAAANEVADVADTKVDISDYDVDKAEIDGTIDGINTAIDGIHTTTDKLANDVSNELVAKGYAKITNEPSLELGRGESDWKVKITNQSVDLTKSGISGAKLSPNPERANETLFRADAARLSNVYFRSADNQGKLGIVAQSNGHISLKEI